MKNIFTLIVLLFIVFTENSFGQTATYTVTSTSAVTSGGTVPSGSSATYTQGFATAKQITSGTSAVLTLSGYAGYKITSIVLEMKSNTSAGAGTLSVVAGSTTIATVSPTANFNTASWYGAYSTTYVNVTKTPSVYSILSAQNVVITIAATTNSLYIQSYTITYAPSGFTVTFDANGGTGTMSNQTASTATALTTNAFTRAGYTFAGWNTAANGSGTAYANSASYPFTANATLYAQWTANNNTITFNGNGSTGGSTATQTLATAAIANLTANGFTRAGYTFANWNTAANGSGTSYANSASYTMGTANVTLYAQWTANNNTITFDGNGSTGGSTATQTLATAATANLNANGYTRTGYTFANWNTAANGSGTGYANSASYTIGTANVTLYAQWTANNNTITFDGNGSTGGSTTTQTLTTAATANLNANGYTRTGYTFTSWNTAANGSGTSYANSASYTMGTASLTLYAQWNINSYTVIFDGNTPTAGSPSTASVSGNYNTNVTLATIGTLVKTGYTFSGWNTASDGSGTTYAAGLTTYTITATNITLYAKWDVTGSYTVTFDANGGAGTMANQTTNSATALTTNAFTRTGYTFAGWNTVAGGSGTAYGDGASYAFSVNVTLYAQWTANNNSITFDGNGSTGGSTATQTLATASTANLTANGYTRTGYTFASWNTAANGSGTSYANSASYTMGTANVTLYAQWTANNNTITFDGNGSTGGSTATQTLATAATANLTANGYTRTGYTFASWNTAANGSGTSYANSASYTMGTTSVNLYAQWTANNNTITFNGNGSTGGSTATQTLATASTANLTANGYTRTGYTFASWNTAANGSGTTYANSAPYTMGTASVTLYAQWTANNNTITFDGNGSTGGSTATQTLATAATANLTTNGYTRTGYTFASWNTAANGSGTSYANSVSYTMGTGNVTLYAQWTANNNTITFDGNGFTGGSTSSQTLATAATANLTANGYTRTGYTFASWNTAANGSGTSYADGASYTMGTANVILYAQWTVFSGPCFSENFSSISTGNNTSATGSSTAWTGNANFPTVNNAFQAGGVVRLGASSSSGSITSSSLSGVSGSVTVSVDVKGWTTVEGNLKVTLNGSSQTATYTAVMGSAAFETKTFNFNSVPVNSTLIIETTTKRAFVDNIVLTCASACTPAADPIGTISGTTPACDEATLSFSGAAPSGDVYYWQNSATGQVTTLGDAANVLTVTGSGNYYVRAFTTATSCWSSNPTSAYPVTITNGTTTVAPVTTQDILTTANGAGLTVSVGSIITSKRWMYSTTSGSGYVPFVPAQTNNTYTPNFASPGTYYVVCEVTYPVPCGLLYSNEVRINVTSPGPPIISHTPLVSTISTVTQTATATITSATSFTCTPSISYRLNGGSWATVNGTNTSGSSWSFSIPGQSAGTLVEYFLTACNASGTVTSPSGVTISSYYGSFNEYTINCAPASSGTQTIAYQGFEFVSSPSYIFSVDNTNTTPTGSQNYPAHASAVEWKYYNQGAKGSSAATNRNACGCMAETYTGLPAACPDNGNPVYTAGGATGFCRAYNGNSRGVYLNTSAATENPTGSRSRNGSYSYIQQSRVDAGISPLSFIYFDDIAIPDAANATNIKVIAYISSISTSTLANGAESADFVELNVKYNSSNVVNTMVADPTCGSDLYFFSSSNGSSVSGTTNLRWDYLGNTWSTAPAISGTTTKNKISLSIPNGTTNVRALIRMLNDDAGNSELWAVDDIQIIADYPTTAPTTGRYFRSRQNGKWENISTWEVSTSASGPFYNACEVPTNTNSDSILIMSGHTVRISANQTVDQLKVASGGKLILSNVTLTVNDQANSTDLLVEGTYEDNSISPNGISFNTGAKWKYTTGATIIKTNTSSVTGYRDNYEGGIASIPAVASWYFRYNGGGNPNTVAVGMFYPTLYFENSANATNFSFNSFTMAFGGSSGGYCTVKGDLNIGTTGTGSVTVYNNNLNSSPMLVNGNLTIGVNSTLSSQFCPACGSADGTTTGDGTGFEVKGNLTVNGILDVNNSTNSAKGLLRFSGTGTQTVSGTGSFDIWNMELNKTSTTLVDQQVNLETKNNLNFVGGVLKTGTNELYVSNSSTNAITGASNTGTDKYIQGRLKRKTDGSSAYAFPVGHSSQNAQGFSITPTGTNGSLILGYLETNNTNPTQTIAYCDLEAYPGGGTVVNVGGGNPGYDGHLDKVTFNLASPLQWDITNPGGGVSSYNLTVLANGGQDITPVVSANGLAIRYLMKNGEPGNPGVATGTGGGSFPQVGFIACPNGYALTGLTSFSKFTLNGANGSGTVLPVSLLYFTAEKVANYTQLNWATSLEINNDKFIVERSVDALNFESINEVKGAGTATQTQTYALKDASPALGWNYYRLKQVDFDGAYEYSGTAAAYFDGESSSKDLIIFPNPAQQELFLIGEVSETTSLTIVDALGKTCEVDVIAGKGNAQINVANLAAGMYILTVKQSGTITYHRFQKMD